MRLKFLLLAVAVLLFAGPVNAQDESYQDQIRTLLDDGISLYKRGKFQESYSKFEQAFQLKPDSDLVFAFIKRTGQDVVAGMMNAVDPATGEPLRNIRNTGHRLFKYAQPGIPIREGKETVLQYIKDLDDNNFAVYRNAFWHLKNYGAWCVRFLVPVIKDQMADRHRSRTILLLTEMGTDASLALIEALDSKDAFLRQQSAIILGNIKDDRALPALKRVFEDPNEMPEVRKFAHEAIQKITRISDRSEWKRATDYYYELAQKYYYSHPTAIHAWERYYIIWKWNEEEDRIHERRVARFAYNEQLAEEALFDLLALDPGYRHPTTRMSAWSLFAAVHFQEAIEARAGIESALQALGNDEITEDQFLTMIQELEGYSPESIGDIADEIRQAGSLSEKKTIVFQYIDKRAKVIRANVLAEIPGKLFLYEALERSLKDGNHLVAKACIDTIKWMGRAEDLPVPGGSGSAAIGYPLIEALGSQDKRVRYAAAGAMAAINPMNRKLGMELVIPSLVDAVGEQAVRVALVIYDAQDDADRNFINKFKKTLIHLNVFPVIAYSGSEGIAKAKQFPTEDIIIIQRKIASQIYFQESHLRKPVTETVFDTLRDDVRTRNTPRLLLCRDEAELHDAQVQFDVTAQGFLTPETHELDLRELLEKLFDLPEAKKDAKDRADLIAKHAAESLATMELGNTIYPFRESVDALIQTVSPTILRERFIRIPAARALGRFGDQRALDVLAKVLDDKAYDEHKIAWQKPLRWECARALSQIFRQTGVAPSREVFAVLKEHSKDGDYDIELVVGEALGNATLTNKQRLELQRHRRIERDTYTEDDP